MWRTNANIAVQCGYHVVWCPKYRRPVMGGRVEQRLKEIIAEVIVEKGAWLMELETMPDHVHLLVEVDPRFGVHRLVTAITGRSSGLLRREFAWLGSRLPSRWTDSYLVATVGGAPLSVIQRYVETQTACEDTPQPAGWVVLPKQEPAGNREELLLQPDTAA
jgi:putative transposase